jgi:type II secretory pathway pseudopilin PulG
MDTAAPIRKSHGNGEDGYILVAVIFMLAILILSMAVAIPRVKEDIQRDREIETMHRGLQYSRAIKLYYKKFNAYPPNIDALVKTNEIRFLRKRYTDPMTGKDDWKPIMFGQNKTPMAMGFFGQPLAGGAVLAGTGPSGGNGIAGASPTGSSGAGDATGGSSFSNGSSFSSGGSFSSGSSLSSGSSFSNGSSFSSGTSSSGASMFGSSGSDSSANGAGAGANSTSGTGGGTTAGGSSSLGPSLSSNQTYGGGGIIGFSPGSDKQSILTYKKKNHYNEWEFLYSPLQDQKMMGGGNTGTVGNGITPVSGQGGQGGVFGNSPFGNSSGSPSPTSPTSPIAPTTPTSPQQ